MEFYIFLSGIFTKKKFLSSFLLIFHTKRRIWQKNIQKYINDVKFSVTANPACIIVLNIKEKPKMRIFIEKFIPQKHVF